MSLRDKVFPATGGLPDFVRRFAGAGAGSLGDDETMQHYLEVADDLTPGVYEQVAAEALSRFSEGQRRKVVEHLRQRAQLCDLHDLELAGLQDGDELYEPRRLAAFLARAQRDAPGEIALLVGGGRQTAFGHPITKMLFATIAALGAKVVLHGYGAPVIESHY